MLRAVDEMNLHPDAPLYRTVIQCSDPEATAWAWSAGIALGVAHEAIIQDDEYDGEGAGIRLALQLHAYIGIHGLAHAGFCAVRAGRERPAWPELAYWTQEDDPQEQGVA